MLIVRRVAIHSWRRVAPGTVIHPSAGVNLLVGGVATGKSTLLALLAMILRSDFSPIEDEDCDIEYDLEYVDLAAGCLLTVRRRQRTGSAVSLEIRLKVGDREFQCTHTDAHICMRHGDEVLASHALDADDDLEPLSWALIAIAGRGEAELVASIGMVGDLLRGHTRTVRLDEGLDVFRAITGAANASCDAASVQLRHPLPPATIARLGSSVPGFASVQLAYQAQVRLKAEPDATTLIVRHDELPMFERLVRILGVERMHLELTQVSSEPLAEATLYRYGRFRFVFQFAGRAEEIDHAQLSHGQKRLLALMYCLDADADHLLADGLPGGLPSDWLGEVLGNLLHDPSASCQAFLSYHDPQLLAHVPPEHPPHPLCGPRPLAAIVCARDRDGNLSWVSGSAGESEKLAEAQGAGAQALADRLATIRADQLAHLVMSAEPASVGE